MNHDQARFLIIDVTAVLDRAVILRDIGFWAQHEQALDQWCQDHGAMRRGMTLEMSHETLSVFLLRWS